ncbi:MAG TPA: helix-turn-helix transcriptional regulator [Anaerolineae bacterium]|nr:helix-turn-helix transcriptional regulator [Anaerolineae bacterium]
MKYPLLHDFFLGFIRIHILFHASQSPVYGTALMQELARHGYRIGPGTLYPILHSLEKKGFLTSQKMVVQGKMRRYYAITADGRDALQQGQAKVKELVKEIIEE